VVILKSILVEVGKRKATEIMETNILTIKDNTKIKLTHINHLTKRMLMMVTMVKYQLKTSLQLELQLELSIINITLRVKAPLSMIVIHLKRVMEMIDHQLKFTLHQVEKVVSVLEINSKKTTTRSQLSDNKI